jgi:hypothetical protein
MTETTTFSTPEQAREEQIRQGITPQVVKPKEKTYYTRPVVNHFRGREVISNIIYTVDNFNPGPMKYRIYSIDGTSKVVEIAEYQNLKDDIKWFDNEGDAKDAAYSAKLNLNTLGDAIKKKAKAKEE